MTRYCAPLSFTFEKSGEKSEVCGSKNSAIGTSRPAVARALLDQRHHVLDPLGVLADDRDLLEAELAFENADTKSVSALACFAELIGSTRKKYLLSS